MSQSEVFATTIAMDGALPPRRWRWEIDTGRREVVAEAILELEGRADAIQARSGEIPSSKRPELPQLGQLSTLAMDAHLRGRWPKDVSAALLETAARLRDGWRPRAWTAKRP